MPSYAQSRAAVLAIIASLPDVNGQSASGIGDLDSLIKSGVLSSLALLELISAVEARFSVAFSEDEIVEENFDCVAAIVGLLETKKKVA